MAEKSGLASDYSYRGGSERRLHPALDKPGWRKLCGGYQDNSYSENEGARTRSLVGLS